MEKAPETLGARLRRLRLREGITAEQAAKYVGVAISTYREWEYGRSIRGEPYVRLAELFKITTYELLTGLRPARSRVFVELEKMERNLKELRSEIGKLL